MACGGGEMRSFAALVISSLNGAERRPRRGDLPRSLGLPPVPAVTAGTPQMRRLGEKLFFDRSLSTNGTLSCAMCHIPAQAYASNQSALSIGMEGRTLRRNAPSLYNVVFKKYLFHDGRETDLGAQVWGPLLAPDEMGNSGHRPAADADRAGQGLRAKPSSAAFPGEGVTMVTLGAPSPPTKRPCSRLTAASTARSMGAIAPRLPQRNGEATRSSARKGGCVACHEIGATSASPPISPGTTRASPFVHGEAGKSPASNSRPG